MLHDITLVSRVSLKSNSARVLPGMNVLGECGHVTIYISFSHVVFKGYYLKFWPRKHNIGLRTVFNFSNTGDCKTNPIKESYWENAIKMKISVQHFPWRQALITEYHTLLWVSCDDGGMGNYLLALTTALCSLDSKIPAGFGGTSPNASQLMAEHLNDVHQVSVGRSKPDVFLLWRVFMDLTRGVQWL